MKNLDKIQSCMPYIFAVDKYVKEKRVPFHMPGHKLGTGMNPILHKLWGKKIFKYDLTEVDGLDYLNAPAGIIAHAQKLAAQAFKVKNTLFLVNGSTLGNEISILSLVKEKEKIIITRNAHYSTFSSLVLSGAYPIYAKPTFHPLSGLYPVIGSNEIKLMFQKNNNIKAIHITSPTHVGFTSDVKVIGSLAKEKNIPLIVDEAHGAHFQFHPELPRSAVNFNTDIVIQSIHKTLGSFTQTSMLHLVKSTYTSIEKLQTTLMLLQSSSPNTLFIMSLDAARQQMATDGYDLLTKTLKLARYARNRINNIEGYYCYGKEIVGYYDIVDMDETKLLIDVTATGYTGYQIEKKLTKDYHVEIEMSDVKHILCFITIGDTDVSIEKLLSGLKNITKTAKTNIRKNKKVFLPMPGIPQLILTPRDAFFSKKKFVSFSQSLGKISGEFIIPFPPDIPIIVPGEQINSEILDYLKYLKENKTMTIGLEDKSLEMIQIIC